MTVLADLAFLIRSWNLAQPDRYGLGTPAFCDHIRPCAPPSFPALDAAAPLKAGSIGNMRTLAHRGLLSSQPHVVQCSDLSFFSASRASQSGQVQSGPI